MTGARAWAKSTLPGCMLWVAMCFLLTSAVYLSWVYRLLPLAGVVATDWLSMAAGYAAQAAGAGFAALWLKKRPEADHRRPFSLCLALFAACTAAALAGSSLGLVVVFGLLMNLLCGAIAGFYLYAIAASVEDSRRAIAFGGGYAIATVALGLMSLAGGGFLRERRTLLMYIPVALGMAALAYRLPAPQAEEAPSRPREALGKGELAQACGVVLLLSLVKNLGFSFPSADIATGLKPELSRLFYAVGLAVAGLINDRSRKHGAVCTAAALVLPFVMLGVSEESVPSYICWGLDYLFYGFFSVFRVVLLLDVAAGARRWELAPLGLLFGRLGDVGGTALGMLLGESRLALVAVTAALFIGTVFLFFGLYHRLYAPKPEAAPAGPEAPSEREVFETFAQRHGLSSRELEVMRLLVERHTNGEIAATLFVSESTVKYHVHNLLQKTGCKNRSDLQKKFAAALYPGIEGNRKQETGNSQNAEETVSPG